MANVSPPIVVSLPIIDPKVEHVGVSGLRSINGKRLREFDENILVIQEHNTPLAVLLGYEKYLMIQRQMASLIQSLEVLGDAEEVQALLTGLREMRSEKTESIESIRQGLEKKNKSGR